MKLTPTPPVTEYAKAFKTGGMEYDVTMYAKKLGKNFPTVEPPIEGQRYAENGSQPAGSHVEAPSGQRHKSISMKRGGGPRNPGGKMRY